MHFFIKKQVFLVFTFILPVFLFACTNSNVKFIEKDGQKQYQKEDGNFAQAEWITLNGNDYHFDMNGYLETNTWVDNEYYVDKDGKKMINAWTTDSNGKKYYLSSKGSYARIITMEIGENYYHFNADGSLLTNQFFHDNDDMLKYSDSNGVIARNKIFKVNDNSYYADDNGQICMKNWKEINNNWYYFDQDGVMQKNKWIDATYYCGNDGKMLKNSKSPEGYEIDKDGKVLEKYRLLLLVNDFQYIYDTYCAKPWAEIGSDGSYISIDTNPYDYSSDWGQSLYFFEANEATEKILKLLNFPEYVSKKMDETSALDGKQSESTEYVTVTWSYRPSKGAETMFTKKSK